MSTTEPKTIRLGICMAGAVSAGAYTAGVIDYLIETLERWQQKKDEISKKKPEELTAEEKLVPMHNVVIEVLSGASAGGMTAAVLGYSFNDNSYTTKRNNNLIEGNYNLPDKGDKVSKLYEAWINMVDDAKSNTFQKLMGTEDVVSLEKMKSILNSQPIDDIANKAIPAKMNFDPPPYVSKDLSLILSITNLEGVPIDIRFSNIDPDNPTCNVLKMHSGFLHYQFRQQPKPIEIDFPPEIITEETKDHLAAAAKATGAFPFGLTNRRIVVNNVFFNEFKNRLKNNYKMNVNLELPKDKNYVFNAIDGGTINNEPMGTTVKILNSKNKLSQKTEENYLVLIDPFPTVTNAVKRPEYCEPGDYTMFQQIGKIIGAIRNQSMFKQEDLLNGLEMDNNRFLIYPAKRKYYFLACGLIEGFSGFFKKQFREHDYQLGRKNCQAFLRYYFGETEERFKAVTGYELSDAQRDKWCYNANFSRKDKPELKKIPLIPDMLLLKQETKGEISTPVYNGITTAELKAVNIQVNERLNKIIDNSYAYFISGGKDISSILGFAMKLFPGFFKGKIRKFLSAKLEAYFNTVFNPQSLKQETLLLRYADIIEKKGRLFQKMKGVFAKVAEGGENVVSKTQDGLETSLTASRGQYIVKNETTSMEEYIVSADKFNDRYVHSKDDYYLPNEKARVFALQLTEENIVQYKLEGLQQLMENPDKQIYIEAPWNESQAIRLNDYLVCPAAKSEVYRIALKEFNETYKPV